MRSQLTLTLGVGTDDDGVRASDRQVQTLDRMLDELVAWSKALAPVRA